MTPPSGAVIGFITFIASTISKVSPAFTVSPASTNGFAPGSGERKAVPTIGDLTVFPETSSSAAPRSSLAWIGGALSAGAAAAGAGAGAAPNTGAASRATLIRRSPSWTSISVSSLSERSFASSRTSLGSIRISPSFAPFGDWAITSVPYSIPALHPSRALPLQRSAAASSAGGDRAHPHLRRRVDLPICLLSMSLDDNLSVRVNGEDRQVPGGSSVAAMVNLLGLDPKRVAVERNLEVIPRSLLATISVEDGDAYEIVHFVGGG